jgi:hypothetical protein
MIAEKFTPEQVKMVRRRIAGSNPALSAFFSFVV